MIYSCETACPKCKGHGPSYILEDCTEKTARPDKKEPWKGKIFVGHSKYVGILRSQDNEQIFCSDPAFENYACMKLDDLKSLRERCN